MTKRQSATSKALNKELVEWRLQELEDKVEMLETNLGNMKLELMGVATKVAIIGSIIGAIGSALVQKYWK